MKYSFLFLFLGFVSCKQKDCLPPSLTLSGSSSIFEGDTLKLISTSVPNATFSWSGPNNFSSTLQNPSIINATKIQSGTYSVTAKSGNCEKTKSFDVVVLSGPACSPANNSATFLSAMQFGNIRCGVAGSAYEITGSGLQGNILLKFYTEPNLKGNYIYDISTNNSQSYNVFVEMYQAGNWQAQTGKVYVAIKNNKLTATFCGIAFGNINTGASQIGSGKLTCP